MRGFTQIPKTNAEKKKKKSVFCSYLPEMPRVALNPLLNLLSPVRLIIRIWSHIRARSNSCRRISLFSDWLRELLCCHSKDLMCQQEQRHGYTCGINQKRQINHLMYLVRAHSHGCFVFFHLQDIEPLAQTVVQGVKLCGQILSHLSGKATR